MSPEQNRFEPYNFKVDIYSLGVILMELIVSFGTEMEKVKMIQELQSGKFLEEVYNYHYLFKLSHW